MAVYKSPQGVVYNLDKFVSFWVKENYDQRAGEAGPLWELVAQLETGEEVRILSDRRSGAEAKCNAELNEIYKQLAAPIKVVNILDAQTEGHLREIVASLSRIGKFTELQAKLMSDN